jgi:hypothetical protein
MPTEAQPNVFQGMTARPHDPVSTMSQRLELPAAARDAPAGAPHRRARFDSFQREPTSPAVRTWLCLIASGDPSRPWPNVEPGWDELFRAVCRNGLVGLARRHLAAAPRAGASPPESFGRAIEQADAINRLRLAVMYRRIERVLGALASAGVSCILLKGPALAYTVYPDPMLRSFTDLDVLARNGDWTTVHRCMQRLGFTPERDAASPPPAVLRRTAVHEFKYVHEAQDFGVDVHYDDILNTGLTPRDVEGFWRRAVTASIQGRPVRVLSPEDQLIQLCAHVHFHGYTRLNWLSDVAFLVRGSPKPLAWDRVVETVRTEEAQVPVYYTLRLVERLLGVPTPVAVLEATRPDRLRRWWHERYLPENRLLSLEPMPRPDFSFYFRPLFKRLLPDLLVMGRRRDKLAYLARLAVPPAAWLRYYYGLRDDQGLLRHYVLHPVKLTWQYLRSVVGSLRRIGGRGPTPPGVEPAAWWTDS